MISKISKDLEGKRIFLKTLDGWKYTVDVKEINTNHLSGTDKFNQPISIGFFDIQSFSVISKNGK